MWSVSIINSSSTLVEKTPPRNHLEGRGFESSHTQVDLERSARLGPTGIRHEQFSWSRLGGVWHCKMIGERRAL